MVFSYVMHEILRYRNLYRDDVEIEFQSSRVHSNPLLLLSSRIESSKVIQSRFKRKRDLDMFVTAGLRLDIPLATVVSVD